MWAGVTPLYWLMYLPAFLNSAPAAGAAAAPAAAAFSTVGCCLGGCAANWLWLMVVAGCSRLRLAEGAATGRGLQRCARQGLPHRVASPTPACRAVCGGAADAGRAGVGGGGGRPAAGGQGAAGGGRWRRQDVRACWAGSRCAARAFCRRRAPCCVLPHPSAACSVVIHQPPALPASPCRPCMSGLWALSRQANYLGEATFWLAGYGAGRPVLMLLHLMSGAVRWRLAGPPKLPPADCRHGCKRPTLVPCPCHPCRPPPPLPHYSAALLRVAAPGAGGGRWDRRDRGHHCQRGAAQVSREGGGWPSVLPAVAPIASSPSLLLWLRGQPSRVRFAARLQILPAGHAARTALMPPCPSISSTSGTRRRYRGTAWPAAWHLLPCVLGPARPRRLLPPALLPHPRCCPGCPPAYPAARAFPALAGVQRGGGRRGQARKVPAVRRLAAAARQQWQQGAGSLPRAARAAGPSGGPAAQVYSPLLLLLLFLHS